MKKAIFLFDYTGIMAKPWADAGYLCYCFDGQHPLGVSKSTYDNILNVGMWFSNKSNDGSAMEDVKSILAITGDNVSFVFGFPECTDLAVSGAAHFARKKIANPRFQDEAMTLVRLTRRVGEQVNCPWALENPVSVISTKWKKPNFKFDPHEYGGYLPVDDIHPTYPEYINARDAYPKKTCIWAGNGFVMPNLKRVGPLGYDLSEDGVFIEDFDDIDFFKSLVDVDGHRLYDDNGRPIWGYSNQHSKLGGKSLKTKNIRSATPRGFAQAVFEYNT
tara:strand:- start:3449 stop:4273 length:825 start_codon:yes stop_codon:yes gene_type:complete